MANKNLKPPMKEILCDSCGQTLGVMNLFKVKKKNAYGVVQHPWSLSGVTEMVPIPEDELSKKEAQIKTRCSCKNWSSIPDEY